MLEARADFSKGELKFNQSINYEVSGNERGHI